MSEPFLECPKSWDKYTLEPSKTNGVVLKVDSGSTPSTTNSEYWDGDIAWLTPKEITKSTCGVFVSKTERSITKLGLKKCAAKLLPAGTVMLTKRAPVGAVAINSVPMCVNQGFLCFQCGQKLLPLYLALWLELNKPYLDKVANGSTYPELYKNDLFEFVIQIPGVDEQEKIVSAILAMRYSINLGLPLEETSRDYTKTTEINTYTASLAKACGKLTYLLMSGKIDPSKITTKI